MMVMISLAVVVMKLYRSLLHGVKYIMINTHYPQLFQEIFLQQSETH